MFEIDCSDMGLQLVGMCVNLGLPLSPSSDSDLQVGEALRLNCVSSSYADLSKPIYFNNQSNISEMVFIYLFLSIRN